MTKTELDKACVEALDRACRCVGSQARLAELLDIRSPSISEWRKRKRVPSERCRDIEAATGGNVTRPMLRPDVFGGAPVEGLKEAS